MPNMKKGTVLDLLPIMLILFFVGVVVIIVFTVANGFVAPMQQSGLNTTVYLQVIGALDVFNYGFLLLFFGLSAAAIISAYFVSSHPIFFIVSFFVWIIMIFLSVLFTNIFYDITTSATLTASTAHFNILNMVMLNLPLETVIIGAVIMIVLYAKREG